MERNPNTFRKYQDADETHAASRVANSMPRCNIGLKRNVKGNGTLAKIESFILNQEI